LFDRDVGRLGPTQNLVDDVGHAPELVRNVWSIGQQTARFNVLPKAMHRRQSRAHSQDVDASPIGIHERVRTKVKCIRALPECLERRCDVLRWSDFGCNGLQAELAGRCLGLAHFQYGGGIADIGHDRQPAKIGDDLAQEFESLAGSIRYLVRQTGDVAARSRQTRDQAGPDRIVYRREREWHDRCRLLCREDLWGSRRDKDIDLEPDELGRDLSKALVASFPPAILDRDIATVDPAKFAQSLHERGGPFASGRTRALAQEADGRQPPRLLRARRERPSCCRAAEQGDELAPFHSITSSARASSVFGTIRSSALAVFKLISNSYLVGTCTGRSAGFSPLRIRSTYPAARRN